MHRKTHVHALPTTLILLLTTTAAQAWDPNEQVPNVYQPSDRLAAPSSLVRYPAVATRPVIPVAYAAPVEPVPITYAPAPQQTAYNDTPPPPDTFSPLDTTPSSHPRYHNRVSFGVEAFYDNYKEPDTFPDLTENSYYGSIEAAYEHDFSSSFYGVAEQRVSYGKSDYKSNQGHIDGTPQWELETRLMGGYSLPITNEQRLKAYAGLGARYFLDQSKGEVSTLGANGYDRRILQLYTPVGLTYEFPAFGMRFAPNVEFDPIIYGNVQSRLGTIPGYQNFTNRQNSGYGVRGEFMMGQTDASGKGWELGPFVRYWNVPDSEIDFNASGFATEPKNERFQTGLKLRGKF